MKIPAQSVPISSPVPATAQPVVEPVVEPVVQPAAIAENQVEDQGLEIGVRDQGIGVGGGASADFTSGAATSAATITATGTGAGNGTMTGTGNGNGGTNDLVQILLKHQFITPEQAEQVRTEQLAGNKTPTEIIKEKKLTSEENLTKAKAELFGIPYIKITDTGIAPQALNQIDEGVARRYRILPFAYDRDKKTLSVAMVDPLDLAAINFTEQKTGLKLDVHYAVPSELERLISERYAQNLSTEVTQALQDTSQLADERRREKDLSALTGGVIREAPINRIVETILDFAMKARASDVHIEPQTGRTRVRYRIDGIMQEKLILPRSVHDAVVSRIKILTNLKLDEKRVPQDGRFTYRSADLEVDLRVSTLPTIHGEKVVMRLLKKNVAVPTLEELGLDNLSLKYTREAIQVPQGIIVICGPTGSGKTTTLYSILNIINTVKVNIMTLEDPVEYQIPGVTQVQINPTAGLTFASGLRSFLRQDPDIIMVGEIRDHETAELAIQASLTGHLVFSTLHTSSASGALPRLLDMGAESFLLASSVTLIMGQRVVRRINPRFKEEYQPEPAVIEDIKQVLGEKFTSWCQKNQKDPSNIKLFRPKTERPQDEPEYEGRVGIFEVMPITEEIRKLIVERRPAGEIERVAQQQGMLLMKQDGYLKVLEGETTIEEVIRVAEV